VQARLASANIMDFGCAVHTAADFYAHSLYAHVIDPVGGRLPLYDPAAPIKPGAREDEVFDRTRFSINNPRPALTESQTRSYWRGKLVSGQWWRWYTSYPDDLKSATQLGPRRCLPDHDLIAVDDAASEDKPNHLYPAKAVYNAQFALRRDAAVRHVRSLYRQWKQAHG
jgi:hypothetical protein